MNGPSVLLVQGVDVGPSGQQQLHHLPEGTGNPSDSHGPSAHTAQPRPPLRSSVQPHVIEYRPDAGVLSVLVKM